MTVIIIELELFFL